MFRIKFSARNLFAVVAVMCSLSQLGRADEPFRFKLNVGEKIVYDIEQETTVVMQSGKEKTAVACSTKLRQCWNVIKRNPNGDVEMELTIERFAVEETDPTGKQVKYDSQSSATSHPSLKDQLGSLIGKPALKVTMSPDGDVKTFQNYTNQKNMSRELPFLIVMSDQPISAGFAWNKTVNITIPDGDGKETKYPMDQACKIESMNSKEILISVQTKLADEKTKPEERLALAPYQPKGQIKMDRSRGVIASADMTIDQTFPELDGPETSQQFKSKYSVRLVDDQAIQAKRN